MASDDMTLLTQEYLQLQKTVEDFDLRTVTIKSWSVTASMVGISAAFLRNAPIIFLLSSVASLMFWLIEARWKEFQQCYYPRIKVIERALRDDFPEVVKPLQIYESWSEAFHEFDLRKFLKTMFWYHVALPHVVIVVGGILLWFFLKTSIHENAPISF